MPEPPLHVPVAAPRTLDGLIDSRIREFDRTLLQSMLELGALLATMKRTRGYLRLDPPFASWEEYLASKELGRTYLSYLLKLGLAGDLLPYAERFSASKLIEVARRTDYPEKIPQLLEATGDAIGPLSVREAGRWLDDFVRQHPGVYKKSRAYKPRTREAASDGHGPKRPWTQRFRETYGTLSLAERAAYLRAMREFLDEAADATDT